jgi:hypothetical protein
MNITETVLSAELTTEHGIEARFLPEPIRGTPLVWVILINTDTGDSEYVLQSRQYVEKFKPEYGWMPALGLYELMFLRTERTAEFHWTAEFVRSYEEFWNNLVSNALDTYHHLVDQARSTEEHRTPRVGSRIRSTANWTRGLEYGPDNSI